jgi:hypothetical protein
MRRMPAGASLAAGSECDSPAVDSAAGLNAIKDRLARPDAAGERITIREVLIGRERHLARAIRRPATRCA